MLLQAAPPVVIQNVRNKYIINNSKGKINFGDDRIQKCNGSSSEEVEVQRVSKKASVR